MYYLHSRGRGAHPTPAEAPYVCNPNGTHEWRYGQKKHEEALRNMKGQVDTSLPHSIDPAAQRIQEHSRRFSDDQRKAEIGRENRKMVERLNTIAKGREGGYDPRGPPNTIGKSSSQPSSLSLSAPRLPKSLIETGRRQTQRTIDESNAGLVRRILHTKGTFDRAADERDYHKHQRAGNVLQRMPGEKSKSCPKLPHTISLPALKPPRLLGSNPRLQLQGLDMLFLPGDLCRGRSGPGSLGGPRPLALTSSIGGGGGGVGGGRAQSHSPRSRSRSHSRSRSGSRRSRSGSRSRSRSGSPRNGGSRSGSPRDRDRDDRDRGSPSGSPRDRDHDDGEAGDRDDGGDQLGKTQESTRREWLGGTQESLGYTQDFDMGSTKRSEGRETGNSFAPQRSGKSQMGATGYSTVSSAKYDTDEFDDEEEENSASDSRSRPPTQ